MKKFLGILLTLAIFACAAVAVIWGKEIKTVNSVEQVGNNKYLYRMDYSANYDLDDLIAADIDTNEGLLNYIVAKIGKGLPIKLNNAPAKEDEGEHCTSFQAKGADSDGWYFGRNYDFFKNPSLVTYSHPKNGYASVAVSDMSHFGYGLDKLPGKLKDNILCLAAVYAPVDGMNEKGLCTSIMALPKMPSQQNTGKHVVGTSVIMRLILDRCATLDEALDLVNSLDIRHDVTAGSGYHYMIADAAGNCAVVEFDPNDGWKTMIVRKEEGLNFMHVTNHLLSPKYFTLIPDERVGNPHSKSWWRYADVAAYLTLHGGEVTRTEAQECLSRVHWKDLVWDNGMVEDTQFSNVYDQQELVLYLRSWYDYDTVCKFPLK